MRHRFASVAEPGLRRPNTAWMEQPISTAPDAGIVIVIGRIAKRRMAFLAPFQRVVVLPADQYPATVRRIALALHWAAEELAQPSPIAEAIVQRLAEITTLEIGRVFSALGGVKERSARQAALDHRLLRAISAFYAAPKQKWSVERLAEEAGMSRTAFAIRYRELIGTTPMKSLRQLRLQLAAEQLSGPAASVGWTAKSIGYGSDTAFIRAFTAEFGQTPRRLLPRKKAGA